MAKSSSYMKNYRSRKKSGQFKDERFSFNKPPKQESPTNTQPNMDEQKALANASRVAGNADYNSGYYQAMSNMSDGIRYDGTSAAPGEMLLNELRGSGYLVESDKEFANAAIEYARDYYGMEARYHSTETQVNDAFYKAKETFSSLARSEKDGEAASYYRDMSRIADYAIRKLKAGISK
jgi:hypothetical protein